MKRVLLIGILAMHVSFAHAVLPSELTTIQQALLKASTLSYDYTIDQKLPGGKVNRTKGSISKAPDYYYEHNSEQTILQTDKWYYKLDHASKSIFIIDLQKVKKEVFHNKLSDKPLLLMPDTTLLRHGKIDIKRVNQLAKIKISFGDDVLVKEIYLEYDFQKSLPIVYKVQMKVLYGIDGWEYEEHYLDQSLTINNFSFRNDKKLEKLSDYFHYDHGKIKLMKFSNYRLIQEI